MWGQRRKGPHQKTRSWLWVIVIGMIGAISGFGLFLWNGWSAAPTSNVAAAPTALPNAPSVTPIPLPTATPVINTILFPGAAAEGYIVEVARVPGGWDVQNLQQLVGHLEGTAWFGSSGNTVLAGHFEDEIGRPGPFRYLYEAQVGDRILIHTSDTNSVLVYEVQQVFSTTPDDIEVLRHTGAPRLTLITCDAWSFASKRYEERLVVVAVPIAVNPAAATTTAYSFNRVN